MDFHNKLPRSGKEFALFLFIVSVLSVNLIAPTITFLEIGFSVENYFNTLKILPFMWIVVVIFVLLTHPIAEKMANNITAEKDSFHSKMTINILCNVLLMSIFLTVIGTWIGTRQISLMPITHFFQFWPRNFTVAFGVELLIAQPIARGILFAIHKRADMEVQNWGIEESE
ncbi:hypothetical protein SAMN02745116_01650 [Pilibacter termitis]|uniref:DUF2798 domain-containing protein n=1 Tax=Pilibacter termitis TaxID=263852 RepID=A0A1T4P586_9ENTE|nr:hypothetical protein [Pilibacter termitis]SJZ86416.1 hypothetical protein SAMN02745116_01650 [Pilibacter termitis]